jgi:uncharacterized protein (TIGR00730 family)
MSKLLCVYCASSDRLDPKYFAAATELGTLLVKEGWGLVYGGGKTGLMGAVARATKAAGGKVVGVIPEFMKVRELAFDEADELISVITMRERKLLMETRADAFVALPGGFGLCLFLPKVFCLTNSRWQRQIGHFGRFNHAVLVQVHSLSRAYCYR